MLSKNAVGIIFLLLLFLFGCDGLPTNPQESIKTFIMQPVELASQRQNDSTYYVFIDTLYWQTFERIFVITSETTPVLISWQALSKKYGYYYTEPPFFESAFINHSSYTDKTQQANTILSIYKRMIGDTVLVMAGYNDGKNIYFDYKYFVIFMKN